MGIFCITNHWPWGVFVPISNCMYQNIYCLHEEKNRTCLLGHQISNSLQCELFKNQCHLMKLTERRTQQIYNREQNHLITSPNWPDRQQPHGKIKTVWGKIDGIRWCDRKNGFQLKHNCRKSNQVSLNMGAWSQGSIKKHANKWSKFTLLKVKLYFLQFSISSVSPHTL